MRARDALVKGGSVLLAPGGPLHDAKAVAAYHLHPWQTNGSAAPRKHHGSSAATYALAEVAAAMAAQEEAEAAAGLSGGEGSPSSCDPISRHVEEDWPAVVAETEQGVPFSAGNSLLGYDEHAAQLSTELEMLQKLISAAGGAAEAMAAQHGKPPADAPSPSPRRADECGALDGDDVPALRPGSGVVKQSDGGAGPQSTGTADVHAVRPDQGLVM